VKYFPSGRAAGSRTGAGDCDKIDASTICRTASRSRLTLLRSFKYTEAVRNNTPGFKYIAGSSFVAALASKMLLMLLSIDGDIVQYQSIHIVRPEQFDSATAQTPGSQPLAAVHRGAGIESPMWGGLFFVEPGAPLEYIIMENSTR
jgi:hypothetical protein